MAKFLFIIPPYFGHINPTLGVGAALIERGHEVIWMGVTALPESTFPEGGTYEFPQEFRQRQHIVESILACQADATKHSANRMIKWAFEEIWLRHYELMQEHLPAIFSRIAPDFIFYDEGLVAAAMVAHTLNIPYATSISSAPGLYYPPAQVLSAEDAQWLKNTMDALKEKHGIELEREILNSPMVNIVYTAKEFVSGEVFSDNYYFTGPALYGRPSKNPVDWSQINLTRKSIYISTGTLLDDVKEAVYKKVIEAFADEDITVLIVADPLLFDKWPDNFIPRSHWPQLEVLQRVDAVISHGGFNTINESLYFGKPVLAIPMAVDQFGNGALIEQSGCGLRLRVKRLLASQLRDSIRELLENPQYSVAAKNMMQKLRAGGGAAKAAELLLAQLEAHNTNRAGAL